MRGVIAALLLLGACAPDRPEADAPAASDAADASAAKAPAAAPPAPAPPAPPPSPSLPAPTGATTAGRIVGEWRVAGVNGESINMPWGVTASIDATTIRIFSQCLRFERGYRLDGERLAVLPGYKPSSEPVCERMPRAEEIAIRRALIAAIAARRMPDRSLLLDGPGGALTLFTQ